MAMILSASIKKITSSQVSVTQILRTAMEASSTTSSLVILFIVTAVKAKPAPDDGISREYDIVFNDEKKDTPIYATTTFGVVKNIVPLEELELVKKDWVGKTIWSKTRVLGQFDAQKGEPSWVKIPLGERLRVVNVAWGTDSSSPIWVIVKRNDGETGYYDIGGTSVNKDADFYEIRAYWDNSFYDHDPRKDNHWSQAIWDKVCRGKISIGMTSYQVTLSIGLPDHTNRDTYTNGSTTQ